MLSQTPIAVTDLWKVFLSATTADQREDARPSFWQRTKRWVRPGKRRRVEAVRGVTFTVERGEVFGLLGPNGSGKSTTIKILLGLLAPTAGTGSIFGEPPYSVAAKHRVGFLPEETYLYRFLNAEETLDFFAKLFGLPRRERQKRIDHLLDMVGLSRLNARKRPIREYSKGMARRIGLAQALINDPDLVILDEPTTGLDPIGTAEIKALIQRMKDEGRTVLLSSHLLADVEAVCDRVAILCDGDLLAAGTLRDLLTMEERLRVDIGFKADTDVPAIKRRLQRLLDKEDLAEYRMTPPTDSLARLFLKLVAEKDPTRIPAPLLETTGPTPDAGA